MTESQKRGRRVLLICDFAPGLLQNVLAPYEFMNDTEVTLVRRSRGQFRVPGNVRVVNVPLPVIGTSGKRTTSRSLALLLNTVSYLFVGSLLSTFAALRFRCNLVHARFLFPEGVVGLIVSVLTGVKLIATAEGSDVNLYLRRRLSHAVVILIAKRGEFIAVSKPIRAQLQSLGVPSHYVPNSVDCSKFKFVPLDKKEKLVIFVGSLTDIKRPQFLVEAIGVIHQFVVDEAIRVEIIGDGPLKATLERRIKVLGLGDSIRLGGYLENERVREYMGGAYAYVTCSMTEGMSVALLEAMASGCVIIASNIPGNTAMIENGKTGLVFDGNDLTSLADMITQAFLNPLAFTIATQNARESIESDYDTRKITLRLAELYDYLGR